jgi:hypothetical protein
MSLNLNRTFNPKFTSYMSDGKGRDSYIMMNNGGLNQARILNIAEKEYSNRFTISPHVSRKSTWGEGRGNVIISLTI